MFFFVIVIFFIIFLKTNHVFWHYTDTQCHVDFGVGMRDVNVP